MCEDGGLIGYGMAPAVYVVPVGGAQPREATGRAVGPVMSSARGADRAGDHPRSCAARCPAGAAARGADPLKQEESHVPVSVTVRPPAGRFGACVVRP